MRAVRFARFGGLLAQYMRAYMYQEARNASVTEIGSSVALGLSILTVFAAPSVALTGTEQNIHT